MKKTYDVAIIGGGPAAYTAAIYASRASLSVVLVTGDTPGGQLLLTSEVENFPGFKDGIMGPELMDEMQQQALRFGATLISEFVDQIRPGEPHALKLKNGDTLQSMTIIIATGASAQWLGLENETRLMGKGISACATCDGYFFKDKVVVVVGGGDTAMEEALSLTHFASRVIVVHRRHELRASKIMQERALNHEKIEFIWDTEVTDVFGEHMVDGIELTNLKTDQKTRLDCQGLFVAIGHKPATEFIRDIIDVDEKGYIKTQDNVFTNQKGVFAAGDVADHLYRQAITAAGDGCRAALEAERYLGELSLAKGAK
ncbi:thioredoxin-disulfide reductase [bacterium]|nr:thioredoxin-disulfide reductase [bacterium]